MKNREKYADFLIECAIRGTGVSVSKNGKLYGCTDLECEDCIFNDPPINCEEMTRKWADAEYEEPEIDLSKVPVDTKMWVRDGILDKWIPRYFSGEVTEDGKPFVFLNGATSFSCDKDENGRPYTMSVPYYRLAEDSE